MMKKTLISLIIVLLALGGVGIYGALKQRAELRQARLAAAQSAKAPETKITLLEGWTNQNIADYLEKNNISKASDFLAAQKTFNISGYPALLDKPKAADLQGYIFPDTYFIPANPTSNINNFILTKALDNFSAKFSSDMKIQAAVDKLSIYQIITLASIIEKESSGNLRERKIVAGIFYNRLEADIALQSDATISFITHKNNPSASAADIEIDSPYNTYKYKGLPPGPICNPGLDAILAALYPAKTDYLYFLTDPSTGRAVFAKTYDEQLKNKQKYLR